MERRAYFIAGDLLANLSTGAVAGAASALLVGPGWPMWLAMPAGMLLGMLLASVLGVAVFFRYFGAMEVMLPTALTGMLAGMLAAMWATMAPLGLAPAALLGVLCGYAALGLVYALDWHLKRSAPEQGT
ncbi:MAG: hypothetical protein SV108_00365 [Pseudomonadota bacterium]|nr:hypothetical protein [Pseudomonadota bacterium]